MNIRVAPGTEGYAEAAEALVRQYESISFEESHAAELHLIRRAPTYVLDIGAGSGRDAAWLASQGHSVVAVEPTVELRQAAAKLHPSSSIEWIDDALPELHVMTSRGVVFDMIFLTAVWMHLNADERCSAMPRLAALLSLDGTLIMSLRHGPVPSGRRMFEVSGEETIGLAEQHGLRVLMHSRTDSIQAANVAAGVSWTRLAFQKVGK